MNEGGKRGMQEKKKRRMSPRTLSHMSWQAASRPSHQPCAGCGDLATFGEQLWVSHDAGEEGKPRRLWTSLTKFSVSRLS